MLFAFPLLFFSNKPYFIINYSLADALLIKSPYNDNFVSIMQRRFPQKN